MDANLTAGGQGIQDFAASAGYIAGEIYKQERNAQQMAQALEGKAVLADLYQKPLIATQDMPYDHNDPDAYKRTVFDAAAQAKQYIDKIQDPAVKNSLIAGDLVYEKEALGKVEERAYVRRKAWQKGSVLNGFQQLVQETIGASPDLAKGEILHTVWDKKMREFSVIADQSVGTETLTAKEADTEHANYLNQTVVGLIQTDPKKAGMYLEAYKPYFDPTAYGELKTKLDKATGEKNGEEAYNAIFAGFNLSDPAGDYEGAIRFIRDPNNLPGVGRAMRETLENQLKGQQGYGLEVQNRKIVEGHNKDLDSIAGLDLSGDVRGAIKLATDSPYIKGDDKMRMVRSLQTPRPEGRSNMTAYLEGVEEMYDTSTPLEVKKTWLLQNRGKLNDSDFKHLGTVGMSQERANDKSATAGGIATIKAVLQTPGMSTQTGKERLDAAIKLYEEGVATNKDTLNTPEKIKGYAGQILAMPKFSNINPIEDMKADMKKMRGAGLSGRPVTTAPVTAPSKTVTIDGKQYRDGDVITKDGKSFKVKVK